VAGGGSSGQVARWLQDLHAAVACLAKDLATRPEPPGADAWIQAVLIHCNRVATVLRNLEPYSHASTLTLVRRYFGSEETLALRLCDALLEPEVLRLGVLGGAVAPVGDGSAAAAAAEARGRGSVDAAGSPMVEAERRIAAATELISAVVNCVPRSFAPLTTTIRLASDVDGRGGGGGPSLDHLDRRVQCPPQPLRPPQSGRGGEGPHAGFLFRLVDYVVLGGECVLLARNNFQGWGHFVGPLHDLLMAPRLVRGVPAAITRLVWQRVSTMVRAGGGEDSGPDEGEDDIWESVGEPIASSEVGITAAGPAGRAPPTMVRGGDRGWARLHGRQLPTPEWLYAAGVLAQEVVDFVHDAPQTCAAGASEERVLAEVRRAQYRIMQILRRSFPAFHNALAMPSASEEQEAPPLTEARPVGGLPSRTEQASPAAVGPIDGSVIVASHNSASNPDMPAPSALKTPPSSLAKLRPGVVAQAAEAATLARVEAIEGGEAAEDADVKISGSRSLASLTQNTNEFGEIMIQLFVEFAGSAEACAARLVTIVEACIARLVAAVAAAPALPPEEVAGGVEAAVAEVSPKVLTCACVLAGLFELPDTDPDTVATQLAPRLVSCTLRTAAELPPNLCHVVRPLVDIALMRPLAQRSTAALWESVSAIQSLPGQASPALPSIGGCEERGPDGAAAPGVESSWVHAAGCLAGEFEEYLKREQARPGSGISDDEVAQMNIVQWCARIFLRWAGPPCSTVSLIAGGTDHRELAPRRRIVAATTAEPAAVCAEGEGRGQRCPRSRSRMWHRGSVAPGASRGSEEAEEALEGEGEVERAEGEEEDEEEQVSSSSLEEEVALSPVASLSEEDNGSDLEGFIDVSAEHNQHGLINMRTLQEYAIYGCSRAASNAVTGSAHEAAAEKETEEGHVGPTASTPSVHAFCDVELVDCWQARCQGLMESAATCAAAQASAATVEAEQQEKDEEEGRRPGTSIALSKSAIPTTSSVQSEPVAASPPPPPAPAAARPPAATALSPTPSSSTRISKTTDGPLSAAAEVSMHEQEPPLAQLQRYSARGAVADTPLPSFVLATALPFQFVDTTTSTAALVQPSRPQRKSREQATAGAWTPHRKRGGGGPMADEGEYSRPRKIRRSIDR